MENADEDVAAGSFILNWIKIKYDWLQRNADISLSIKNKQHREK